jgi:hypothetical protein
MKKTLIVLMMVLLCAMLFVSCSEPKATYSVGDTVNFGTYPANYSVKDFQNQPIAWKVLSVDTANSRMLVISDRILETDRQFDSSSSTSYSSSSIKAYLNGEFITKYGLSSVDKCNVDVTTKIEETAVGSGSDKVFLLSKAETENTAYFANDTARIASDTSNNNHSWWLRSATANSSHVYCVTDEGSYDDGGTPTYNGGLRPAMWVNF